MLIRKLSFILIGPLPPGYADVRIGEVIGFLAGSYFGYVFYPPDRHIVAFGIVLAGAVYACRTVALLAHDRSGRSIQRFSPAILGVGVCIGIAVSVLGLGLGLINQNPSATSGALMGLGASVLFAPTRRRMLLAYVEIALAAFCFLILLHTHLLISALTSSLCLFFGGYAAGTARDAAAL